MVRQEKALRSLWNDRCSIIVRRETTDPITRLTDFTEEILYDELPCKLSFKLPFSRVSSTGEGRIASVDQSVKLFLAHDIDIPAGSKITVTHGGKTQEYARSSQSSVFSTHQEVNLMLFEKWA